MLSARHLLAIGTTSGAGTLNVSGAVFDFNTAAVTTPITFDAATNVVGGTVTIPATEQLTMIGGTLSAAVVNQGLLLAHRTAVLRGTLTTAAGTLVNALGAVITPLTGAGGPRTLAAQLDNQSTITIGNPVGMTLAKASAVHTNRGTIAVTGGTFTLTQTGTTPTFTNTGTVNVASSRTWSATGGVVTNASTPTPGSIIGAGTVSFGSTTFVNDGVVAPAGALAAGILNYTGPFALGAAATLNLELGGTAVSAYDKLAISGTAALGGTLNVTLFGGFTPIVGATFSIMTYSGTPTGAFTTTNLPPGCSASPLSGQLLITC